MMRKLSYTFVVLAYVSSSLFAVPPYFWYSTHSIENYAGNGSCGWPDLSTCHDDADGLIAAVSGHSISNKSHVYNRRDAACTAARWSGYSAEINFGDFMFYAGHGWGIGPYLGCNTGYPITSFNDIRFGGYGYLKWVQAASCEWFVHKDLDPAGSGKTEFERWTSCFKGVHAVQGHRAITYDHGYSIQMSDDFFDRWVDQGDSFYWAWREAQILWVWGYGGNPGLQPATAGQTQAYAYETWANAGDDLAPDGMNWLGWATIGTPEY